jgi:fumarate hydratase, class II
MSCEQRAGFAELTIPANEPSSSIMPGKVIPTRAETFAMVSARVIGDDVAKGIGGASGYLEMSLYKRLIIFDITHSIATVMIRA